MSPDRFDAALAAVLRGGDSAELAREAGCESIRLNLYVDHYLAVSEDTLSDAFPGLRKALGDTAFVRETVAHTRAAQIPFLSGERLAAGFAERVAGQAPDSWIASLASLELAVLTCARAPTGAALDADELRAMRLNEASRLTLASWTALARSDWRLCDWYGAMLDRTAPSSPAQGAEFILTRRVEETTSVEAISPGAFALLSALGNGKTLGQAVTDALEAEGDFDLAAELAALVRRKMVVAVNGRSKPDPRAEPFGHVCGRCTLCCRNQTIRLDPYEVARLAVHLSLSTRETAANFTQDGAGTVLNHQQDGACVFLDGNACSVWSARPSSCRLYPLRLTLTEDGSETFGRSRLPPGKVGRVTSEGTIGDFLRSEEADPFIAASNRYYAWLAEAELRLGMRAKRSSRGLAAKAKTAAGLIDMDEAIARHCRRSGKPEPKDLAARLDLHLEILEASLDTLSSPQGALAGRAAISLLANALGVIEI